MSFKHKADWVLHLLIFLVSERMHVCLVEVPSTMEVRIIEWMNGLMQLVHTKYFLKLYKDNYFDCFNYINYLF
jgi:hypothetical protein